MQTIRGIYDGTAIKPLEPVHAQPNAKVIITFLDDDARLNAFPPTTLDEVAGCLHYNGPPKTLMDMEDAIERGVREQWR